MTKSLDINSGKSHHKRGTSGINKVAAMDSVDIGEASINTAYNKKKTYNSEEEKFDVNMKASN